MSKAPTKSESAARKITGAASSPSLHEYTRVETRWHEKSRELQDLTELAEKIKGNPTRRGEAAMHLVVMWSRVLHGELSPSAFWELFGVSLPAPQFVPPYPAMSNPGLVPVPSGVVPISTQQSDSLQEDPKVKAKRERIAKNQTQANVWAS